MSENLGMIRPGSAFQVHFNTFDSNDPSASVAIAAFVLTDVHIYKDGGVTQRASDSGVTLLETDGIDFDGHVGIGGIQIDLSDNDTAGFYVAGSRYSVIIGPTTVDAAVVNFIAATFEIGYPDAIVNTTIATLASQTSFTLTAGSAEANTYKGWKVIVHDIASAVQLCIGYVSDYAVTSKTVTLAADPGVFTMAVGDNVSLFPPDNVVAWLGTAVSGSTAGRPDVNIAAIFNNILPALILERWLNEAKVSTADSGTITTLVDTSLSEADDRWNRALLVFTTGTNNGYTAIVTDFDAATDTLIFIPAVPDAVTTEDYILIPGLGQANVDAIWDEAIEDHVSQGTTGFAALLSVYMGPDGPGIFVKSSAANTNTVLGTDGTEKNPVSTFAAARTLADALGTNVYYLEGNSDITLAATHEDWEFIGIGSVADNTVNLGSQDVDRSLFRNLTIEGTQGGTGRITSRDCALQDPGAGTTTLHIFAERCGIVDDILVDTSADNVFDGCFSLAASGVAPIITATGASGSILISHWGGRIELKSLSASHNIELNGHGHVIFNADCNVNANVEIHGVWDVTDNTAGMSDLATEVGLVNMTKINEEADTALSDYDGPTKAEMDTAHALLATPAQVNTEVLDVMSTDTFAEPASVPAATASIVNKIGWVTSVSRNKVTQTATKQTLRNAADDGDIATATISGDGVTATRGKYAS